MMKPRYAGLVWNQSNLEISSDCVDGPSAAVSFAVTYPIGRFWGTRLGIDSPSLTYQPVKAGATVTMWLRIFNTMVIRPGETVVLSLGPGWGGRSMVNFDIPAALKAQNEANAVNGTNTTNASAAAAASTAQNTSSGNNTGNQTNMGGPFQIASWFPVDGKLILTALDGVKPFTASMVVIPSGMGIQLPRTGIRKDDPVFSLMTDAFEGPSPPTPMKVPPVGSFLETVQLRFRSNYHRYLEREVGQAGVATKLDFTLNATMWIRTGEKISVLLPTLGGPAASVVFNATSPTNTTLQASWTPASELLVLTVLQDIPPMTTIDVSVPSTLGVTLPAEGLRANLTSFYIFCDAADGPVAAPGIYNHSGSVYQTPPMETTQTTVNYVQPVGSFMRSTVLRWIPTRAGQVSQIILDFVPQMQISPGETVSLYLPNFFGNDIAFDALQKAPVQASWRSYWNATQMLITFTVGTFIEPRASVTVVVPKEVGIRVPVTGVRDNQVTLQLMTNAADGPILPTSVATSQPVGALVNTSVSFSTMVAGQRTAVVLSFSPLIDMVAGDYVSVGLGGFLRSKDVPLSFLPGNIMAAGSTAEFQVLWTGADDAYSISMLLKSGRIPRFVDVSLSFPFSMGIALPLGGLRPNQAGNTISTSAVAGPVPRIPILSCPAVGSFKHSELRILRPVAGSVTGLALSFIPYMRMQSGDVLSLRMVPFSRDAGSASFAASAMQTSPRADVFSGASWDASSSILSFTVSATSQGVMRNENFTVILNESAGLRLRGSGLQHNHTLLSEAMSIFTNAVDGPVLREPMWTINAATTVGSFMDSTSLSFEPRIAGKPSSIHFTFAPRMPMLAGDMVTLKLPGFTGPASTHIATVMTQPVPGMVSSASWDPLTAQLSFKLSRGLLPDQALTVIIPRFADISLPALGVRLNDPAITVMTNSSMGPVLPVAVRRTTVVPLAGSPTFSLKSMYAAPKVSFSPLYPGAPTSIAVEFRLRAPGGVHPWRMSLTLPNIGGGTTSPALVPFVSLTGTSGVLPVTVKYMQEGLCNSGCETRSFPGGGNDTCAISNGTQVMSCSTSCIEAMRIDIEAQPGHVVPAHIPLRIEMSGPFTLPTEWFPAEQSRMTATVRYVTNGTSTQTETVSIEQIPLGSFVRAPSLSFKPALSGTPNDISISFQLSISLRPGDALVLSLPSFGGHAFVDFPVLDSQTGRSMRASWTGPTEPVLRIIFLEGLAVTTCSNFSITVPARAGVHLPVFSSFENNPALRLSIFSAQGIVTDMFASSPAVGSFATSPASLSISVLSPGARSEFSVTFSADMTIRMGDSVGLVLSGFTGKEQTCAPVISRPLGAIHKASWNPLNSTFIMTAAQDITRGSTVAVTIPYIFGLSSPPDGLGIPAGSDLRTPSTPIRISTNTAEGPNPGSDVHVFPRIGSFQDSRLDFLPAAAEPGDVVSLIMSFTSRVGLVPGDVITLSLPGFFVSPVPTPPRVPWVRNASAINGTLNGTNTTEPANNTAASNTQAANVSGLNSSNYSAETLLQILGFASSGIYTHPAPIRSALPAEYQCVACGKDESFDGIHTFRSYYASLCGLGGARLRSGLHKLLLSTHRNVGLDAVENIIAVLDRTFSDPSRVRLVYTDGSADALLPTNNTNGTNNTNASNMGHTSSVGNSSNSSSNSSNASTAETVPTRTWAPSFVWPRALGVGYTDFTCTGNCSGSSPMNDLHHQFAAEIDVIFKREFPFKELTSDLRTIYKTSMLLGECTADMQCVNVTETQSGTRSTSNWSTYTEIFEPSLSSRGDIARAAFYMAVRYDGEDGVTDLELKDFTTQEDPECCTIIDVAAGCRRKLCHLGQLSTLLRWHAEDPVDDFERRRNDEIHVSSVVCAVVLFCASVWAMNIRNCVCALAPSTAFSRT
jgi:hypothetical protein